MTPFPSHPALQLLAPGAVFLTDARALVVADLHLGKSATFRARGLPIPEGDTAADLQRLQRLVTAHGVRHLIVAGDLFHTAAGLTPELERALGTFIDGLTIPMTLVIGNHDLRIPKVPKGLRCVPSLDLSRTIRVIHDPDHASEPGLFHISGHWHPVVRIPDGRRTSLRLPCFLNRANALVLPAFGSFTGGAIVKPQPGDRVFVGHQGEVIELPAALLERNGQAV